MAKTREEMQDIALHQMEKSNRRNTRESVRPLTLAEQFAEEKRMNSLTPAQRAKEMPYDEWRYQLELWMKDGETQRRHGSFTSRFVQWVVKARENELRAYHAKGASYASMANWLKDQTEVHTNR